MQPFSKCRSHTTAFGVSFLSALLMLFSHSASRAGSAGAVNKDTFPSFDRYPLRHSGTKHVLSLHCRFALNISGCCCSHLAFSNFTVEGPMPVKHYSHVPNRQSNRARLRQQWGDRSLGAFTHPLDKQRPLRPLRAVLADGAILSRAKCARSAH